MNASINFFPLGNADTVRLDLADGRKILVDYAAMRNDGDDDDKRCDLPTLLRNDLSSVNREYFDAVCITHTDSDHCKGFGEFFWLEHAGKYQEKERIKINELWVPAAAVLEENLKDDARLVRAEARHRLREGKGIRVFSRPDRLKKWFEKNEINFENRRALIVDAGQLVPGYSKHNLEKVEFFVHSPFGWRQDDNTVISRNEDSIALHVTFREGNRDSCMFMASDLNYEILKEIIGITRKNSNDCRLRWDIMKLMHHCSYLSLGPERGVEKTSPISEVKWLFEDQGETGCVIVSPSNPIPRKGSQEDQSNQPPHRQAANYYRYVVDKHGGEFIVTMEHPLKAKPKPFEYIVTASGIAPEVVAPMAGTLAAASRPRAG